MDSELACGHVSKETRTKSCLEVYLVRNLTDLHASCKKVTLPNGMLHP